ncbi:MAG: DUF928 domain-containing protein [Spirulina sp.]
MRQFSRGFIAFFLVLGSFLGNSSPLLARGEHSSIGFIPPDDHIGEPRNVGGGGSRGNCWNDPHNQPPVTILAPELPTVSASAYNVRQRGGRTANSFPALFVYLPQTHAEAGDFLLMEHLEDGSTQELHHHNFSLPDRSGIIRFSMPIALEAGKTYEWQFSLFCDPGERGIDVVVSGKIERVSLPDELTPQIEEASLATQIELYGKAGLWYEFFALLTDEKMRSPQLQDAWQTAIEQNIALDLPFYQMPFLPCCSIASEPD